MSRTASQGYGGADNALRGCGTVVLASFAQEDDLATVKMKSYMNQ